MSVRGPVAAGIHTRRSVGRVTDQAVTRSEIEALIAAALRAPNHGLTHPWRFVVLTGDARRAAGDAHVAAIEAGGRSLDDEARAKEATRFERAPAVVACVCAPTSDDPVVRCEDRDAVSAGVQNLLLAAAERGLGAIWRTGAMVDEPALREHLGVGPGEEVVAFVYLGRPAGDRTGPATSRPRVDEVTDWRGLGS